MEPQNKNYFIKAIEQKVIQKNIVRNVITKCDDIREAKYCDSSIDLCLS